MYPPINEGGCDALALFSILRGDDNNEPHERPKSIGMVSIDGRENVDDIPKTEMVQIFSFLAHRLSKESDTPHWQKTIAKDTFEEIKSYIKE